MSEQAIVNILLNKLENNNINYSIEEYCYASIADVVIKEKNIAIEAKLKDIKKAILQIIGHSKKYKITFLYMPYNKKNLVKKYKNILEKHNIRWFFVKENKELVFGHGSWRKILFS